MKHLYFQLPNLCLYAADTIDQAKAVYRQECEKWAEHNKEQFPVSVLLDTIEEVKLEQIPDDAELRIAVSSDNSLVSKASEWAALAQNPCYFASGYVHLEGFTRCTEPTAIITIVGNEEVIEDRTK